MNIFFTGTHRTGKTTLAQKIADHHGLQFIQTNVSEMIGESGSTVHSHLNGERSIEDQLKTQLIVATKLNRLIGDKDGIVTDRSLIDVLAYTNYIMRDNKGVIPSIYHDVVGVCMHGKYHNAYNFIVQINKSIGFDASNKSGDYYSQQVVENMIMNSIDDFNSSMYCKVRVIPKEVIILQDRIDWVYDHVN